MVDVQWAFISLITASIAHFILRIVLGKELGPDGLGIYTLAFTIYLFGMQFAAFGIGAALTKYVAEFLDNNDNIRNYVSSGLISSLITGTIMAVLLFFLAPYIAISFFHVQELEVLIQITAFCYPFIAIQKAVLGTLNGFRKMHLFALLNIIQNASIFFVSIILVLIYGMGILGAVFGFVVPTIIVGMTSLILIRDTIRFDNSLFHIPSLWNTTIFGFYIVLGNSISFLNTQVSTIIIGFFLNPTEVGIYAVAVLLAQIVLLIPSAVQQVMAPITANLFGKGEKGQIKTILFSTMKKMLLISISIAIFITVFGQYIISIFFSEDFLSAYIPLIILLLGNVIFAPFVAVGATLSSIGKVRIPFRINAICAFINIVLNLLFIPIFGIIGAAIGTSITLILSFTINIIIINEYIK